MSFRRILWRYTGGTEDEFMRVTLSLLALQWTIVWNSYMSHASFDGNLTRATRDGGGLPDIIHDSWLGVCSDSGRGTQGRVCPPEVARLLPLFMPDTLLTTMYTLAILLCVGVSWRSRRIISGFLAYAEIWLLTGLLMMMRGPTIFSTHLPAPDPVCYNATDWDSLPPQGIKTGGWWLIKKGCNNLMFSGHVDCHTITFMMFCLSYLPIWAKVLYGVFWLFASFMSTILSDHYTMDVIVAMYITIPICLLRREHIWRVFNERRLTKSEKLVAEHATVGIDDAVRLVNEDHHAAANTLANGGNGAPSAC